MPLVSVIVPVYNTEKYLDECICSILGQSMQDIELILIDDGSTDRSGDICEKYKLQDSRVNVFHTENRGMIMSRREGVLRSKSKYITFVDSDDFIDRKAYELAEKEMRQDVDVICFGIRRYKQNIETLNQEITYEKKVYNRKEIEDIIYPHLIWPFDECLDPSLCTKLIKRNLLIEQYEKIKDMNISYAEDAVTIYPIIKKISSIAIKGDIYYNHRIVYTTESKSYIKDDNYYDKVCRTYAYFKKEFSHVPVILTQIDKHFVRAVNYRNITLDNWKINQSDVNNINSYGTLIIYGAGIIAKRAIVYLSELQINKYIVAVSEAGQNEYIFGNKIYSITDVDSKKEDTMVLIAISRWKQKGIKENLSNLGYHNIVSLL